MNDSDIRKMILLEYKQRKSQNIALVQIKNLFHKALLKLALSKYHAYEKKKSSKKLLNISVLQNSFERRQIKVVKSVSELSPLLKDDFEDDDDSPRCE